LSSRLRLEVHRLEAHEVIRALALSLLAKPLRVLLLLQAARVELGLILKSHVELGGELWVECEGLLLGLVWLHEEVLLGLRVVSLEWGAMKLLDELLLLLRSRGLASILIGHEVKLLLRLALVLLVRKSWRDGSGWVALLLAVDEL
jgi:hypothetical protein